jgi:hypothetical protein
MTVAVAPTRVAAADPMVQTLLMRFIGALNRRRSYAASHPMVIAAEDQLHEAATALLAVRPVITIGVARTDLLIDGEPYETRSSFARELATRLHRRGVGAVTMQAGVPLLQLRETLAWLATEPDVDVPSSADRPPVLSSISITPVAYDQLALGDVERAAEASSLQLWRTMAQLAGETHATPAGPITDAPVNHDAIAGALARALDNPDVARRTAVAFMDLAAQASVAPAEGRVRIGEQLNIALSKLGATSFAPVIRSLGERSLQQRFVSQVVDVLPVAAVAGWLQAAAQAEEQQMSHHMLRLMTKMSAFADTSRNPRVETAFRGAAQELVHGWSLEDPNPDDHVALLDRIALHERAKSGKSGVSGATRTTDIESSRLVQMALEVNVVGEDAIAAAEALIARGAGHDLLAWVDAAAGTSAAAALHDIATSEHAIRTLLLTEPVDRLHARALLERLGVETTETLIDVLEAAEARGTRMIVRQRLSEFGVAIVPNLMARLDSAPWYLVRNILTLLHDVTGPQGANAEGLDTLARLLDHPQPQVRTEALRLLLLDDSKRDAAIRHALHDDNERIIVLALQALTDASQYPDGMPRQIATDLMAQVDAGHHSDNVRSRMVRALAGVMDEDVRDWLIGHVARKSRLLRRLSLVEPTQTAVAALHTLQRSFGGDPVAAPVIVLARKEGNDRRWQARDPGAVVEHAL